MFKGAISLCPIFAFSLACVVPPAVQGEVAPAAAGPPTNNYAVVSIAHVLDPDDGMHAARCVEKSAAVKYPVSAMTACVYEFSATNPGTLRFRELPAPHEALKRNVLKQIVPGASK
jgi:hypothetical protein